MKLTGSGIGRAVMCPASALLPQTASSSGPALDGQALHNYLRDVSRNGVESARKTLALVRPDLLDFADSLDLSALPASDPGAHAAELAYAYNVVTDTARILGRSSERGDVYGDSTLDEIVGTMDSVGITDDAVLVDDYKFGHRYLGPAGESWQLKLYALAAARAHNKRKARVRFIRFEESGEHFITEDSLDGFELDAAAQELRTLHRGLKMLEAQYLQGLTPPQTEGEHCTYCPAFARCPAKVTLASQLAVKAGAPEAELEELRAALSANPRAVVERLELVKQLVDRIEETIKEYARANPVDLGGGFVYGPKPHPRPEFDGEKARAVLAELYGQDVAETAVQTRAVLTKASLEEGVRLWVSRNKGAKLKTVMASALEYLKAADAHRVKFTLPVMRHRPKAEPQQKALPDNVVEMKRGAG